MARSILIHILYIYISGVNLQSERRKTKMRIYDLKDLSIKLKIGIRTLREYIKKRGLKARKGLLCDRTEPYLF